MADIDGTILAFDYGSKRIGVARADSVARLVEPLEVVESEEEIAEIIRQYQPALLVVGLPRSLDGSETDQTKLCREFAARLKSYGLPVELQDEALTTVEAENQNNVKPDMVDAVAASIILESYLRGLKQ